MASASLLADHGHASLLVGNDADGLYRHCVSLDPHQALHPSVESTLSLTKPAFYSSLSVIGHKFAMLRSLSYLPGVPVDQVVGVAGELEATSGVALHEEAVPGA